ncbi:MAG TPA: hypothetical protein VNO22_13590 [Planctomycetota bacterium]|nr:hypothetical protein [Planctomycetota bacterium]
MRRTFLLLLASLYVLQTLRIVRPAPADAAPGGPSAPSGTDPCCSGACGCPDEMARRRLCCCGPEAAREESPRSPKRPAGAFEAARCRGAEAAVARGPVLPPFAPCFLPPGVPSATERPEAFPPEPPDPVSPRPPDKVPIAAILGSAS